MARRTWSVATAACLIILTCGCSSGNGGNSTAAAVVGAPQQLTGNELRYGASPQQHGPIVYQPNVVLLGGGADAVRSVSNDGLVWTIDSKAQHADELAPGKILFATSFGAGQVLALEHLGDTDRVALGPVALTDIIKDGSFATDSPVPLTGFHAYSTATQPGLETSLAPVPDGSTANSGGSQSPEPSTSTSVVGALGGEPLLPPTKVFATPAAFTVAPRRDAPTLPTLPAPSSDIPDSAVGSWNLQSVCCTSIGVHIAYDKGGARVQGTASLKFERPSVSFDVSIAGGRLVSASAKLHGAAALSFSISAAVEASSSDFKGGRVQVPIDLAIPIPVGNIPVTIGIQQIFSVSLGLGGRAALSTSGEYALDGTLGFSVKGGVATADVPALTTTKSALDAVQSLAVAPSALTFAYAVKVSIGIGPPGLSAGIWYQVAADLGLATSGAQVDQLQGTSLVTCKKVTLSVLGRYGVGYTIPSLVADAINFFLRTVMKTPPRPIAASGGPSWGPTTLYDKETPPCSK